MIDNDPSNSIRPIAGNLRVSAFLFRPADSQFFLQDEKGPIFISDPNGKKKGYCTNASIQPNMICFFSDE